MRNMAIIKNVTKCQNMHGWYIEVSAIERAENEGSTHTLIMAYVINFVACKSYIITKHVRKTYSKKNTYVIKLGTIMK